MQKIAVKTLIVFFLLSISFIDAGKTLAQTGKLNAEAYFKMGKAHIEAGRWQEAIAAFKRVIKLKPDLAEAHYNLGIMCIVIKDRAKAYKEYEILKTLKSELADRLLDQIYASWGPT